MIQTFCVHFKTSFTTTYSLRTQKREKEKKKGFKLMPYGGFFGQALSFFMRGDRREILSEILRKATFVAMGKLGDQEEKGWQFMKLLVQPSMRRR